MQTACARRTSPSCRARCICCWPAPNSTTRARWSFRRRSPSRVCRLPGSGLYASIVNVARREEWQSPSTRGHQPAVSAQRCGRPVALRDRRCRAVALPGDRLWRQLGGARASGAAGAFRRRRQGRVRSRGRRLRAHVVDVAGQRRGFAAAVADAPARMGLGAAEARGARDPRASSSASRPRSKVATRPRSRR